jgi:uncharacterized protein YeaO (DUF488 family)
MNQHPPANNVRVKHASDPASVDDGKRILIDRTWPRGLSQEAGAIDEWIKQIAPSPKLAKWFGLNTTRWAEFCDRYSSEIHIERLDELRAFAEQGPITLVYAAKDPQHNTAVALRDLILHVHTAISSDASTDTIAPKAKHNGKDRHKSDTKTDLARWDGEGGAGPDGPQDSVAGSQVSSDVLQPVNLELVQLRVRVIALENLVITLLAEASDRQLNLAREMAKFIAPQPNAAAHPLAAHAAAHMVALIDRARHFRVQTPY